MTDHRPPGALQRLQAFVSGPERQPPMQIPRAVSGPLGTVPGAPIDTARPLPEPRKISASQAQALMMAELLDAIRSIQETQTELVGRMGRRGAVNGVLDVWAGVFPAVPVISRTYEVAAGSIVVYNLSAAGLVTVVSGIAAGDTGAQGAGFGVGYCPAGQRLIMPLADHSFTMSGTAADKVHYQVFAGLQPYGVNS